MTTLQHQKKQNLKGRQVTSSKLSRILEKGLGFLGGSAAYSTMFYLKRDYSITPDNFAFRSDEFIGALDKMFGAGSTVIQRRLMVTICAELKLGPGEATDLKEALQIAWKRKSD